MSEILYESSSDIVVRTDYERCSKVEHFTKCNGDHTFLIHIGLVWYLTALIPHLFHGQIWPTMTTTMMITLSQPSRRENFCMPTDSRTWKPHIFQMGHQKNKALKQFQELIKNLPEGITGGKYTEYGDGKSSFSTFICREGRLVDYFDIDSVFEFYYKLGLRFPQHVIDQVKIWCNVEIKEFGKKKSSVLSIWSSFSGGTYYKRFTFWLSAGVYSW